MVRILDRFEFPEGLYYSRDHLWAKREDGTVRVGATDRLNRPPDHFSREGHAERETGRVRQAFGYRGENLQLTEQEHKRLERIAEIA
jgi:hypothetical protein